MDVAGISVCHRHRIGDACGMCDLPTRNARQPIICDRNWLGSVREGDCVFVNAVFSSDIQPRIPKRHEFHPIKTLIYEQHNVLISVKWSENRQYQSENRQYQSHTM